MNFKKLFRATYHIFSPRTAPSFLTITSKAGLGFVLIQMSTFLKSFFQEKYPDENSQHFAQSQEKIDFLQSFTFSQFLERSGQILLMDAALDCSKILNNIGVSTYQKLKHYNERKEAQKKLMEINEALKQKRSRKKKDVRKAEASLEGLRSERDKIESWLENSDRTKPAEFRQSEEPANSERTKKPANPETLDNISPVVQFGTGNFVYITYLLEFTASLYIMASLIEPLHQYLNRTWISPEPFAIRIDEMISEVKGRNEYLGFVTPFTIFLNYFFSPKIAVAVALFQIVLNQIDFRKHGKAVKLLGNIPIIGLINSLGFKVMSNTATYELSKYAAGAQDHLRQTLKDIKNLDSLLHKDYLNPYYDTEYEKALKSGLGKEIAKEYAQKKTTDHINGYLQDLKKFNNRKWTMVSIAWYINFYGSFKAYRNLLHIVDNIFDILENPPGEVLSSNSHNSEKTPQSSNAKESLKLAQRLKAAQSDIEKLSLESEQQKSLNRATSDFSTPVNLKAVSYQPQGVVFPEVAIKSTPKERIRNPATNASEVGNTVESKGLEKSPDTIEAEKKKNAILSLYPFCNKELFRTILHPSGNNTHKTLTEKDILNLAFDLKLDVDNIDSGRLILVHKQFGASFHFSKDRSHTVDGGFVSEFRKAFKAIDITIEDLDEIDRELDAAKCCKGDIFNKMTYVLTARPKESGRRFY